MSKFGIVFCVLWFTFIAVHVCGFLRCPTISKGYLPNCVCRYGSPYDNVTNTCPNPKCPTASIGKPSYPNCKCTEKNFEYSEYLNDCFRVCPENSTGYWPSCSCDDNLATFDKARFKCFKCPDESDSCRRYPNCNCPKDSLYDQHTNMCWSCPENSFGEFPNCACTNKKATFDLGFVECRNCPADSDQTRVHPNCDCSKVGIYNQFENKCTKCPSNSTGIYPNCECIDKTAGFRFNTCEKCPDNSIGNYPNCTCSDEKATYNMNLNACKYCPVDSSGKIPNCVCSDGAAYIEYFNDCEKCPSGSYGVYPKCACNDGSVYDNGLCKQCPYESTGIYGNCKCTGNSTYDEKTNLCYECPSRSTGMYPACKCEQSFKYNDFTNECESGCGNDSTGVHPHCKCKEPGMYYDANALTCKSNIGRQCPEASIGIGPDCLCVDKDYKFNVFSWYCVHADTAPAYIPWCVLKSCIG